MEIPTISGYYNITYPNYENGIGSSIYCVTESNFKILTIIILTPNFYNDIARIIKKVSYTDIYIVPPALDIYYISDVYATWLLCKKLGKTIKILSNDKHTFKDNEDFRADILEDNHFVISKIDKSEDFYEMNTTIDFVPFEDAAKKSGNDIVLYNGRSKIYFMLFSSIYRIYDVLDNQDLFNGVDEVHIPLKPNLYGGNTYEEMMINIPKDKRKMFYANSLKSKMELYYCIDNKIQLKENFSHVFI